MKKMLLFGGLFLAGIYSAVAQKRLQVSVGIDVGYVATYDLAVFWGTGVGGSLKAAYPFTQKLSGTFFTGYSSYIGFSLLGGYKQPSVNAVPVRAGLQYNFYKNFFAELQAGISILSGGGEIAALRTFNLHGSAFSFSPQIGYQFMIKNKKRLELSARYESADYTTNFNTAGMRLAYIF
ncbi:MAG: hypothetical protein QM791_05840 [Ferruginibacter sp.]